MSAGEYLVGLAYFAGTLGCVLLAARVILRRRLPELSGVEAVLAFGVLATTGVLAVHLLPGLVGLLSRTSVLVCSIVVLIAAMRVPATAMGLSAPAAPGLRPSGRFSWLVAGVAIGVVAVASVAAAWSGAASPSLDVDTLTFHLPNIARWIQSGSYWQIDLLAPLQPTGHYPNNGDVVVMSGVLPWRNDAFVRTLGLPFAALAGLAIYAIATEIGAPKATAALLGAVFVSIPAFVLETYEGAKTDPVMLAAFGSGVFFLLRHFRTGHGRYLVLGGLALGLSFGTKWYALTNTAALLVAWAATWLLVRRGAGQLARAGLVLIGLIAAAGGFWLVRNLVESGNPVFPVRVAPLGLELFDAPKDLMRACGGFAIADYLDSSAAWKDYFVPAWRDLLGVPGLACLAAWVVAVGMLGVRRLREPAPAFLAACVALMALAYSLTPYTALGPPDMPSGVVSNVRWLLPALVVAAALTAWVVGRLGRARRPVECALLVAALAGVAESFSDSATAVAGASAAVAVAVAAVYLLGRRASRPLIGVAAAVAILVVAAVGYERQRAFNDDRYEGLDPAITWLVRNAPEGTRVGLAGPWDLNGIAPVHPAFGPHLRNRVEYVGPLIDHHLHEYSTSGAFLDAVDRGGYDLLLVGEAEYQPRCPAPGYGSDENAWLREAGFRRLAESDRLTLYRVPGS